MQMWIHSYQLQPRSALNVTTTKLVREGVLVKALWPDGLLGYADLHPWPELGDPEIRLQKEALRTGRLTVLAEQTLWLARRDAEARKMRKSLFDGYGKVKNNATIGAPSEVLPQDLDLLKREGFSTLKLKVGKDLAAEVDLMVRAIAKGFMLRLDFNLQGGVEGLDYLLTHLPRTALPLIEYIEDPFPYNYDQWQEWRGHFRLACDMEINRVISENLAPAFDVLILKPAKTDVDQAVNYAQKHNRKITVTSYMDHPVGVVHSASVASELKKKHPSLILDSGCLTHRLYDVDIFSANLNSQGPYLLKLPGNGIGFDQLLENLPWQKIYPST